MRARRWVQAASLVLANPWFAYLGTRTIYQGGFKGLCFPGLNCYGCPFALFSCPIGSLQHGIAQAGPGSPGRNSIFDWAWKGWSSGLAIILYVAGLIGITGVLFGRLICGWICPFGFLQDLLYKIPVPKIPMPRWMRYGKYAALALLVFILPFLLANKSFCRLCPAGTLEALLPLELVQPKIPLPPAGWWIWVKIGILAAFLLWMVVTSRPFCRAACPLGACYGLLNKVSIYRIEVDPGKCTKCMKCRKVCPVDINIFDDPDSPECIRCLECRKACPEGAIMSGFIKSRRAAVPEPQSGDQPG